MKKFMMMLMAMMMCFTLVACGDSDSGKTKIGVIQYAQHPALDQSYEGFMDALKEEIAEEFPVLKITCAKVESPYTIV